MPGLVCYQGSRKQDWQSSHHRNLFQCSCQFWESTEDSRGYTNHLSVTRRKVEKAIIFPTALQTASQVPTRYVHRTAVPEWETYLIHTSIGKEQCGVIQGDCRGWVHIGVLVFLEEVNEPLPDLAGSEWSLHLEAPSCHCPKQVAGKWQNLSAVWKKQQQTTLWCVVSSRWTPASLSPTPERVNLKFPLPQTSWFLGLYLKLPVLWKYIVIKYQVHMDTKPSKLHLLCWGQRDCQVTKHSRWLNAAWKDIITAF